MGPGELFSLFRAHPEGLTKTELAFLSGVSRTTVNQRLGPLLGCGLLTSSCRESRGGGRPADRFVVNDRYGVVLVADMGASGLRVAICDMSARILAERTRDSDIAAGPVAVLGVVDSLFQEVLADQGLGGADVRAVGIDVPGPVDHGPGRVITPPIMTGWHDFDIPGHFAPRYGSPVLVENDVNAMAFGEHHLIHPDVPDLVFLKIGTGIGAGIIVEGDIYRGADGAAGDVGHIQIDDLGEGRPLCRCGRLGCIEAHAGGWAIMRDLSAEGVAIASVADVARLIREGHPGASRLYRRASQIVGTAVSDIVSMLNPRIVVLGGQLAGVTDTFVAGVREVVYRRSLPLATRQVQIVPSRLGAKAGVHGMTRLALDLAFEPARIDALLAA
jgi:predicted NBD/HSP70 family sugar kinase